MTKVFEALERHQKDRVKNNGRDLLSSESDALGQFSPDGDASPATNGAGAAAEYELPSLIGAPMGPRSSDGAVFPSLNIALTALTEGGGNVRVVDSQDTQAKVLTHSGGMASVVKAAPARQQVMREKEARPARPARRDATGEKEPAREKSERLEKEALRPPREIPVERIALPQLHPRLILLTDPDASECEQFRTLRTQLFHAAEKQTTQVVVVTSALPGEGKTSTTLNLAFAIAQSKERRVLVIDGDLRRPSIASYLGARPKIGLGEVLTGAAEPLDSIFCIDEHDLYVMPVCRDSSNPTELLSSGRLEKMLDELRDYFDFILVDSPPVMPFADTRLLANHTDSIILVVRAGMAPYETVEKTIEALPPGRILGVVLNIAENLRSADYYDYYQSYAERTQRRSSFWQKIKKRIGASWVGKRMDLKESD